jgi:hypothetical protein
MAAQPSVRGEAFDAAMKALRERGKSAGRMQTWRCDECSKAQSKNVYYVLVGKVGCGTCHFYEERVELDPA